MRLVDTHTGELKEYTGYTAPPYIALSHRWTDDEITFKDYIKGRRRRSLDSKKILELRKVARSRNIGHVWIDTVCIDKQSNSELSEAINSMFRWYENAIKCYAYLSDIHNTQDTSFQQLRSSVWFTRGWTLQELVAPQAVRFFTSSWEFIGVRGHWRDHQYLGNRIDNALDAGRARLFRKIADVNLTEKRGRTHDWLRNRSTTHEEDLAYCVMGLFGVNIPLLYGEGSHAWIRLQEEIIRTTHDESIFAWSGAKSDYRPYYLVPILARSPHPFESSSGEMTQRPARNLLPRPPYSITNHGLELRLKAGTAHMIKEGHRTVCIVPLNCSRQNEDADLGDFIVLVLLQQPCGHFDRLLVPSTTISHLASDSRLIRQDETIYVHTTMTMRWRCRHNSDKARNFSDLKGYMPSWAFSLNPDLDDIFGGWHQEASKDASDLAESAVAGRRVVFGNSREGGVVC